jgi:hypothetical protein
MQLTIFHEYVGAPRSKRMAEKNLRISREKISESKKKKILRILKEEKSQNLERREILESQKKKNLGISEEEKSQNLRTSEISEFRQNFQNLGTSEILESWNE